MSNIFMTGGTGFLGSMLIDHILSASTNDHIYAVVRGKNYDEAYKRLSDALKDVCDNAALLRVAMSRVHVYVGDVTSPNLGLTGDVVNDLAQHVDVIFHSAAVTDLSLPIEDARRINTEGTRHVLDLAMILKKTGRLKKVNHISTAYVAGTHKGIFKETDLDVGQKFHNTYEQTKFEAEKLVHKYRKAGLDIDVYRPSIILGSFKDGKTTNFKMFYQPLHLFSKGLYERIPAAYDSRANLINIDTVAKAIFYIATESTDKNMTYHIASPNVPTLEFLLNSASDFFGFKRPDFVSLDKLNLRQEYTPVARHLITPFVPYFNYNARFDTSNTARKLSGSDFFFPVFDKNNFFKLFNFCDKHGFIKRRENPVHAEALK